MSFFDKLLEYEIKNNFKKLNYIESTGTQWIDSKWFAPLNTSYKIETEFYFTAQGAEGFANFCGVNTSNGGGANSFYNIQQNGVYINSIQIRNGDNADTNVIQCPISKTDFNYFSIEFNGDNNSPQSIIKVNENSYTVTSSVRNQGLYNLYIFIGNRGGLAWRATKARMKYFRIYENYEMKRNFNPVLDKVKIPCLYDKISKSFFYNQGTGTFLYN